MTNQALTTTEVPVTLPDGTVLRCQVFDFAGETRVYRSLARKLYETYGPGGYFESCRPAMDYLKKNGFHAELAQMVSDLTRLTATKTLPDAGAVEEFRTDPRGLAHELWLRTRATHPEIAEPLILAAVGTEVTAWQVWQQLTKGLAEDTKRRSASADGVLA